LVRRFDNVCMKQVPTHHRAVAICLAVAVALGLSRIKPAVVVAVPPVLEHVVEPPVRATNPQTATARELEALPGIGPSLAKRIVAARSQGLVMHRPQDLLRIRGIGARTLERIAPYLTFESVGDGGVAQ
jgi:competence protein ComEA